MSRAALFEVLVAPAVAVALTLIFFAVFNRWDKLDDPINSVAALAFGVAGFVSAIAVDRRRSRRHLRRTSVTSPQIS